VRKERLELSQVAPPDPKSGASANFATSAGVAKIIKEQRTANSEQRVASSE